ncbi:alpha/beta hydrolase [Sphingomonas sp. AP4-R1]|uniref:alpha/beta hydrolase family protein n=1 Tax=Sphingomonas sp. AP4-R1 TaxID=2735134 RepID=UPI0014939F4D|nr:alpha/beta hydrolase [Sphingomonas sp. AP4-R1]QJU59594.1 alpha/beta hydrolase [Sphingomonas sp. AP4-R1]
MIRRALPLLLLSLGAIAGCRAAAAGARPERIAYGADPLQHVDLWRPEGKGPFPVVLMIHGGCWRTHVATADIMDRAAADLRAHGIAVWNIEYRGIDRPGGGYPGTFRDVAAAADLLAREGARYRLRTAPVMAIGHSAGGHLALWLAARPDIAPTSPLHGPAPLPIAAVVSLGGLPDLEAAAAPPGDTCRAESVLQLVDTEHRRDPFADTSPARLPQPTIPILLINGIGDGIAPPDAAEAYAARVGNAGIRRIVVPGDGHMDEIAPGSASWTTARNIVMKRMSFVESVKIDRKMPE